jgi:hypothetical protein
MHPAAISGQMIRGMPAFAIGREAIPAGGRSIAAPGPLVPPIGPQPRRCGLACAPSRRLLAIACRATGRQHLYGGVVRCPAVHVCMHERGRRSPVQPLRAAPLSADCCAIACRAMDGIGQRLQQRCRLADPIGQRRAVQAQPVTLEDLALAIERQMIGVFIDPLPGRRCLHRREGGHGPAGRGRDVPARSGAPLGRLLRNRLPIA